METQFEIDYYKLWKTDAKTFHGLVLKIEKLKNQDKMLNK